MVSLVKPEEVEEFIKKYDVIAFFEVVYYEIPSGHLTEREVYPAGSLDMEGLRRAVNQFAVKNAGGWSGYISNPLVNVAVEVYCLDENKEAHYLLIKDYSNPANDYFAIDVLDF